METESTPQNIVEQPKWTIPDAKSFQTFLHTQFPSMIEDVSVGTTLNLLQNQKIVSNFLRERTPYRGLLLYHGLGSGKSAASITIAEGYVDRDIVVFLPASLHSNFSQEMQNFSTTNRYTILHYNSPLVVQNILKQLLPKETYADLLHSVKHVNRSKSPIRIYPKRITKRERLSKDEMMLFLDSVYNPKKGIENPLSGKTIIIDEVHNLTSMIIGGGTTGALLYEMIISARDLRLVCLSGTPAINSVYELAILFNMLRGYTTLHTFTVAKSRKTTKDIEALIRKNRHVNRVYVKSKTVSVSQYPVGFKAADKEYGVLVRDDTHTMTDEEFHETIQNALEKNGIPVSESATTRTPLFEDILHPGGLQHKMVTDEKHTEKVQKSFLSTFSLDNTIRNPDLFKKRIAGLVSFFSGVDKSMFPDLIQHDIQYIDMSNFQCKQYAEDRRVEAVLEKRKKFNNAAQVADASGKVKASASYFRVLSRQSSLYAFPPFSESGDILVRPRAKLLREEYTARYKEDQGDEDAVPDRKVMNAFVKTEMAKRLQNLMKNVSRWCTVPYNLVAALSSFAKEHSLDETVLMKAIADHVGKPITDIAVNDLFSMKPIPDEGMDAIPSSKVNTLRNFLKVLQFPLEVCSPKFTEILATMNASPGLIFSYTQFRSAEGIEMYKRTLLNYGYKEYSLQKTYVPEIGNACRYPENGKSDDTVWHTGIVTNITGATYTLRNCVTGGEVQSDIAHVATFSLWTGTETSDKSRLEKIQGTFNDSNNRYGQTIQILLATESGAEGISLKNVRQVHVFEPFWNEVRIEQVVGRARRVNSHAALPQKQRNVEVFNYVARLTDEQKKGTWVKPQTVSLCTWTDLRLDTETLEETKEQDKDTLKQRAQSLLYSYSDELVRRDEGISSDEMLMKIATRKNVLIQQFFTAMKEAAVDCMLNKAANRANDIDVPCMKAIIQEGPYTFEPEITKQSEDRYQKVRETTATEYSAVLKTDHYRVVVPLRDANELIEEIDQERQVYDFYLLNDYIRESKRPSFIKHVVGTISNGVVRIKKDINKERWLVLEKVLNVVGEDDVAEVRKIFKEKWTQHQAATETADIQQIIAQRLKLLA